MSVENSQESSIVIRGFYSRVSVIESANIYPTNERVRLINT